MLVENQIVETTWTSANKKYYENFGYLFTKCFDKILVNPEHLPSTSKVKVNVKCDDCGKIISIPYFNYIESLKKYHKYLCRTCSIKLGKHNKMLKNKSFNFKLFLDWCKTNNYTPISTENDYVGVKSKLYFICPLHGKQSTTCYYIKNGQKVSGCCKGSLLSDYKRYTHEEVKNIIESKNNNILLNEEEYIDCYEKNLKVICGSCGKEFITNLTSVRKNTGKCPDCGSKQSMDKNKKRRAQDRYNKYKQACEEKGYEMLMSIDDFYSITTKDKIKFLCKKHGVVEQQFYPFCNIDKNTICYKCGIENMIEIKKLSKEKLIEIIESKNNNKLLNAEEYTKNNMKNLKILCGSCKKTYTTSIVLYDQNIDGKCPDCSEKSYGEYLIALCLDKYNISYSRQEHFNGDCRDINPLPFDFYLPKYNICIEFDGKQHFEPTFGMDAFLSTLLHDGMKNNYCKWNNIRLIRIPYWDRHNIEQILIKELNLTQQEKQTA